jgi:sugar O-acyltransferase (sialic acid O-acetyltransferase NeuD family)
MLLRDNQPLSANVVDVFGHGDTFHALLPLLEREGLAIGSIFDDTQEGFAFESDRYAKAGRRPTLFCVASYTRMRRRGERFVELEQDGVWFCAYVSPQAILSPACDIGNGSIVNLGAVIGSHTRIGRGVYVNIGTAISHHVTIGDNVCFGPGVAVSGHAAIHPQVFVGAGATIADHVTIGEGALIAAGAVVIQDVPPHVMVAGVPATARKLLP